MLCPRRFHNSLVLTPPPCVHIAVCAPSCVLPPCAQPPRPRFPQAGSAVGRRYAPSPVPHSSPRTNVPRLSKAFPVPLGPSRPSRVARLSWCADGLRFRGGADATAIFTLAQSVAFIVTSLPGSETRISLPAVAVSPPSKAARVSVAAGYLADIVGKRFMIAAASVGAGVAFAGSVCRIGLCRNRSTRPPLPVETSIEMKGRCSRMKTFCSRFDCNRLGFVSDFQVRHCRSRVLPLPFSSKTTGFCLYFHFLSRRRHHAVCFHCRSHRQCLPLASHGYSPLGHCLFSCVPTAVLLHFRVFQLPFSAKALSCPCASTVPPLSFSSLLRHRLSLGPPQVVMGLGIGIGLTSGLMVHTHPTHTQPKR